MAPAHWNTGSKAVMSEEHPCPQGAISLPGSGDTNAVEELCDQPGCRVQNLEHHMVVRLREIPEPGGGQEVRCRTSLAVRAAVEYSRR
jgi:hypothetical protein